MDLFKNIYLLEMINFSEISFHQTIKVATWSGFSDFVDFLRIIKINEGNHC